MDWSQSREGDLKTEICSSDPKKPKMKATAIRLSLCVLLIFGITAKPYKLLGKLTNEVMQETVSKYDAKGVGPDGNAWKSVEAEQYKPPLKAEEDKQKVDVDPVWSEVDSKEPEQDWDEVYHKHRQELLQYLAPLSADYSADAVVRSIYSEPQKSADEVYHGEKQYSDVQTESEQKVGEDEAARVYLQPEEDKDALYHKDVQQLILQSAPKAAAPIDVPSPRRYSEPEEDLDDLYHR